MSAKRGATGLCGALLIDKPSGCTSHDVVNRVRRATGERRVGHAGTLDPLATGLLIVLVGPYTRLEPYLSSARKSYRATIVFGSETDTDDAEGAVTVRRPIPREVGDSDHARSVLNRFLGISSQQPPAYSAIKVGGQVAHRVARAGGSLEVAARDIEVTRADLVAVTMEPHPTWTIDFAVSKGTYIRALARDIGRAAKSAAHLDSLRRTSAGCVDVSQALTLDQVESIAREGRVEDIFTDPVALVGLPVHMCSGRAIANGQAIPAPALPAERYAIVVDGRLAAIYRHQRGSLVAEAVFPTPEEAAE